jgi:hypothetical protein
MADLPFPRSLPEFQKLFPDDAACAAYLETARWREGFVCGHCNTAGEPFRFEARPGVLRCRKCRKDNRLTAGTVMEGTHTPLSVWFWAAYLVSSQTPGMSAVQFQRQLGLSRYATAHAIFTRLNEIGVPRVGEWSIFRALLEGAPMKPGPKPQPLAARFAKFVDLNGPIPAHRPDLGPCHLWIGAVRKGDGYGAFTTDGKTEQAHRVAFKIAEGRWPEPCALHHCDTRLCVNRAHLFEGSRPENTADMVTKGRGTARALSDEQVADIVRRKAAGETQTAIAADLGVSQALVSLELKRRA